MPEDSTAMVPATGPQALVPHGQNETAIAAVASQAVALVQARYTMAMARPRDWDQVRVKLLEECKRPGFCEAAYYRLPLGDGVRGLTIRFAEAAMRCMGNLDPTITVLYDDDRQRIVRASVTDLESNVSYADDFTLSKTVERKFLKKGQKSHGTRLNSYGDTLHIVDATEGEILAKQGALASKRLRTLALRLLPGDLKEDAERQMAQTLADEDKADPKAAMKRVADNFHALGIEPKHLTAYLGHALAQITPMEMNKLRGLYPAIRDGEVLWADIMAEVEPSKTEKLKTELTADDVKAAQSKPKPADPGPTSEEMAEAEEGPAPTEEEWEAASAKANEDAKETATEGAKGKPPGELF